jgi:hypothetical protein
MQLNSLVGENQLKSKTKFQNDNLVNRGSNKHKLLSEIIIFLHNQPAYKDTRLQQAILVFLCSSLT